MKSDKLSAVRIVFGVFFSILFFPIMLVLPIVVGHVWIADNDILNKEVIIKEFEEINGYERIQEIALEALSSSVADEMDLQEKIVTEVLNKDCIDEISGQILDRLFEGKDIEIDLEDEIKASINSIIGSVYDEEAEGIIEAWINGSLSSEYKMIYDICGSIIDDEMVAFGAKKVGVDKSFISVEQVRKYLNENPLTDSDKKQIIDECKKIVDTYVVNYSEDIAKDVNSDVAAVVDELKASQDIEKISQIIRKVKTNANMAIVLCMVVFAVMWGLLLLIFKARRAAFFVPAVAVIFSAIAYFAEYVLSMWLVGKMADYVLNFENNVEILAWDFITSVATGIENSILVCGIVTFVAAIVLIILGTVIHIVRKNRAHTV